MMRGLTICVVLSWAAGQDLFLVPHQQAGVNGSEVATVTIVNNCGGSMSYSSGPSGVWKSLNQGSYSRSNVEGTNMAIIVGQPYQACNTLAELTFDGDKIWHDISLIK